MGLQSLKSFLDSGDAIGILKALGVAGNLSADLTNVLQKNGKALAEAIESGDENAVKRWLDKTSSQVANKGDADLLKDDTVLIALRATTRKRSLDKEFTSAFFKSEDIDITALAKKHNVDIGNGSQYTNILALRQRQIEAIASSLAMEKGVGTRADYMKDASAKWAESQQKPPQLTLNNNVGGGNNNVGGGNNNVGGGNNNAGGGNNNVGGGNNNGGNPPPPPRGPNINVPEVAAAKISDIKYHEIKPTFLGTWLNRLTRGESSIPYGDFDAAAAQAKMDKVKAELRLDPQAIEKGAFAGDVIPKNSIGWVHINAMLSWKEASSQVKNALLSLGSTKSYPIFHKSLPNYAADSMYIRPVIKEIDGRMHASGFSGAVYDMQVKMRNLTEAFAQDGSTITPQQLQDGLKKIHREFMNVPENREAGKLFVKSLDPIIKELENRLNAGKPGARLHPEYDPNTGEQLYVVKKSGVIQTDHRTGEPLINYPEDKIAFKNEYYAKGKLGLTADQVQAMLVYYRSIRDDANAVINDQNFLMKEMNHIPGSISGTNTRAIIAEKVATVFLGYHRKEGCSTGGLLSKMGSEVEARLSGLNVFLEKSWDNNTQTYKFDAARHEVNAQLERMLESGMGEAAAATRTVPHKARTDGNVEAVQFTLFDRYKVFEGKGWTNPAEQNKDLQKVLSVFEFGSEEMPYQYYKRASWLVGPNSNSETADLSQVLTSGIETFQAKALKDGDMRSYYACKSLLELVKNFLPQQPIPEGARAGAQYVTEKFGSTRQLRTLFASGDKHEFNVLGYNALVRLSSYLTEKISGNKYLAQNIKDKFTVSAPDVVASAPSNYDNMMKALNDLVVRPIANFTLGIKTTPNHSTHYSLDNFDLKTLLWFGNSHFAADAKVSGFDKVIDTYDRMPMWLKTPTRVVTGAAIDAIDPNAKDKIGFMSPVVKTVWAGALASTLYAGLTAPAEEKVGQMATELATPTRLMAKAHLLPGIPLPFTDKSIPLSLSSLPGTFVAQGFANLVDGTIWSPLTKGRSEGWNDWGLFENSPMFNPKQRDYGEALINKYTRFDGSGDDIVIPESSSDNPSSTSPEIEEDVSQQSDPSSTSRRINISTNYNSISSAPQSAQTSNFNGASQNWRQSAPPPPAQAQVQPTLPSEKIGNSGWTYPKQ